MAGNKVRYDLTGQVFGKLTVIEKGEPLRDSRNPNWIKETTWRCRCECGNETTIRQHDLLRKDTKAIKSCGCNRGINSNALPKAEYKVNKIECLKKKLEDSQVPFEWYEDEDMQQIYVPCFDPNKRLFSIYKENKNTVLMFADLLKCRKVTLEYAIARISEYWEMKAS